MGHITSETWLLVIRFCFIAILTSFILFSGFLLPMYLRGLQQQELERIKNVFGAIRNTSAFVLADSATPTFRIVDYITPVLFTAFIVLVFATIAMFGSGVQPPQDYILGGAYFSETGVTAPDVIRYEAGTMTMLIFTFFGSFIWSVQYILGRVMTRDISPGEFYKIAINMVFAIILAVAIRHSITAVFGQQTGLVLREVLPTTGFLVGLFPNFFMEWLAKTFKQKWFGEHPQADSLDLMQVEGLSDFVIFRLKDLDIYNAQNLAFANPVSLYMRTRFGLTESVDWVDQALLLTSFKFAKTDALRTHGIRTVSDFVCVVQDAQQDQTQLNNLGTELDVPPQRLTALVKCTLDEPAFIRLAELRKALAAPIKAPEQAPAPVAPALPGLAPQPAGA